MACLPGKSIKLFRYTTGSGQCNQSAAFINIACQNMVGGGYYLGHYLTGGDVIRLYEPGYQGCWYVYGEDNVAPTLFWPGDTPYSDYGPASGLTKCRNCRDSVILISCDHSQIALIYGTTATALSSIIGSVVNSSYAGMPLGCYEVHSPDSFISSDLLSYDGNITPVDAGVFAYTIPSPNNCAICNSTTKCIRLTDCATNGQIFDFYLEDSTNAPYISSILGGVSQVTIPDTMVNEVTGLQVTTPFTSCFNVISSDRDPSGSPGCSRHDVVFTVESSCESCGFCFDLISCDNPGEAYTVHSTLSDENGDLYELVVQCASTFPGGKSTIKIDLNDGNGYRCFQITATCGDYVPLILDDQAPLVYELFCDDNPCVVCLQEPICYQVTMCESGQIIVLQDPTMENGGSIPLGNYYRGRIEVPGGVLIGCFTIEETACGGTNPIPVIGGNIVVDDSPLLAYASCEECYPPPTYKLSRCDDPGIYYIVNNSGLDISSLSSKVIRGLVLYNCAYGPTPCAIKPEHCWLVTQWDPDPTLISVVSYDDRPSQIFSTNAEETGCECCLETPYVPPTD